jgi:hypothetical protein
VQERMEQQGPEREKEKQTSCQIELFSDEFFGRVIQALLYITFPREPHIGVIDLQCVELLVWAKSCRPNTL